MVKFTANNNPTNPMTDNSPIIKSVKESTSQLGLEFEIEEKEKDCQIKWGCLSL